MSETNSSNNRWKDWSATDRSNLLASFAPHRTRKLLSRMSLAEQQEIFLSREPERQLRFLGRLPGRQLLPFLESLTEEQRQSFEESLDDEQQAKLKYLLDYSPIFLSNLAFNSLVAVLSLLLLAANYLVISNLDVAYVLAAVELGVHSFWLFPGVLLVGVLIFSRSRKPIWSLLGTSLTSVSAIAILHLAFIFTWGALDEVPALLRFSASLIMLLWMISVVKPQWFKEKPDCAFLALVGFFVIVAINMATGWWTMSYVTWFLGALFSLVTGYAWGTREFGYSPSSNPLPTYDDSQPTLDRAVSCCGTIFAGWFAALLGLFYLIFLHWLVHILVSPFMGKR
ncbi:magnesium transporter MgtE N-terminal domain-containing protein [Aliagarivorans taiwanensis]|uniref:magnesium transporter MgtE N-terminal domain-containing protein n=1 Tax=Aliagarivorans taiwanensis TaxID=561966 RepID=UPI0004292AD9|nr:hypothetical protein [Aliagarivorans taiwanensis]